MIYFSIMKNENPFPNLGFGCMRLPKGFAESESVIMHAINLGVDYFDTAYIYPGNEELLGKILEKNGCRNRVKIATKLPHYLIKKSSDPDRYFETQKKRLRTDYIDRYLIHMLPDVSIWNRLKALGLPEWLAQKKASGEIGEIGFSYHGSTEDFLELLNVYPWDFCLVQYNYMDENTQAGRIGVETAHSMGIPVIIMEPLRGGLLVNNLPPKAKALIEAYGEENLLGDRPWTPAEWALRWLWDQEAVSCVLSGMNDKEMLEENIRISQEATPGHLSDDQRSFYKSLKEAIEESVPVGCTGCGYCMPCPFGVNIPGCFRCYNVSALDGYAKAFKEYMMATSFSEGGTNAGRCTGCGACISHCPQEIPIPKELSRVKGKFEHLPYRIARRIALSMFTKKQ